jgi:DUF4097 and DUF4098 domain-containing protein YvlB
MEKKTIATDVSNKILVDQVSGELQVKGWERNEIFARTEHGTLAIDEEKNHTCISCSNSLQLRIPLNAAIQISEVSSTTSLKLLKNSVFIKQVHGCLSVHDINTLRAEIVNGDLYARVVNGSLQASTVNGNVSVRQMAGDFKCDRAAGNLSVRDLKGALHAHCMGNARLDLSEMTGNEYSLSCGGNLHVYVPDGLDAEIRFTSDAGLIRLDTSTGLEEIRANTHRISGSKTEASIEFHAGGVVYLSFSDEENKSETPFKGDDLLSEPESFATAYAKADARVSTKTAGVQRKLDRKLADVKRKTEIKTRLMKNFQAGSTSATENEHLIVLRMLAEKKISVEQANLLLIALEDEKNKV